MSTRTDVSHEPVQPPGRLTARAQHFAISIARMLNEEIKPRFGDRLCSQIGPTCIIRIPTYSTRTALQRQPNYAARQWDNEWKTAELCLGPRRVRTDVTTIFRRSLSKISVLLAPAAPLWPSYGAAEVGQRQILWGCSCPGRSSLLYAGPIRRLGKRLRRRSMVLSELMSHSQPSFRESCLGNAGPSLD